MINNSLITENSDSILLKGVEAYSYDDEVKLIKYICEAYKNNHKKIFWIIDNDKEHSNNIYLYSIIEDNDLLEFDPSFYSDMYDDEANDNDIINLLDKCSAKEITRFIESIEYFSNYEEYMRYK